MKLKSKTTLYWASLLLWLAAITAFVIYPLIGKVKAKSEQLEQEQVKMIKLETQSKQLNKLKQEYQNSKEDFKKINELFIEARAPVGFLNFLRHTAADTGVKIEISPASGQKRDEESWTPTFFKISGTGDFQSCAHFITKLERAPYLVRVESLKMNKEKESGKDQERKTQINLSIKVYQQ